MRCCVWFVLAFSAIAGSLQAADKGVPPRVLDNRLTLELFAAEPQIVTPTGIAVDDHGRVLCVENHTHFRPNNYQGPASDRIRRFEDTDGDGRADRITTFHEGERYTMNVAIAHDGSLLVATRREIFRLRDKNDDGVADERTTLVRLETKGDYPHNGLSGFAFDFDGNIFFGLGENLGEPFKLIGGDNSTLSGREGGYVYRCGPNGEKLHQVAEGFWNPFHLATDSFGRLFAVDNDPDARPPCRLLHVVEGGDYGFRFHLGRRGTHPFQSWNGELPGTLPMAAGTGEAPCGVMAYESDGLPPEYFGDLLVTSWGDHRIERHTLVPRGASYGTKMTPLVTGGEDFRPVGIALATDGSLFVSDWVKRDYNLHGHGRIWHLKWKDAKPERPTDLAAAALSKHRPWREAAIRKLAAQRTEALNKTLPGEAPPKISVIDEVWKRITSRPNEHSAAWATYYASFQSNQLCRALILDAREPFRVPLGAFAVRQVIPKTLSRYDEQLLNTKRPHAVVAEVLHRMASMSDAEWAGLKRPKLDLSTFDISDPFLQHAARRAWARFWQEGDADRGAKLPSGEQRLAAILVMRSLGKAEYQNYLAGFLADEDPRVRFVAVKWIGEERLGDYRKSLDIALGKGKVTRELFEGYLAALAELDAGLKNGLSPGDAWDRNGEQYVAAMVENDATPTAFRRLALRMLRPTHKALSTERMEKLLTSGNEALELEAVRSLRDSSLERRGEMLRRVAANPGKLIPLRAEAIVGMSAANDGERAALVELAVGGNEQLAVEAMRSLVGAKFSNQEKASLAKHMSVADAPTKELGERLLAATWQPARPATSDLDAWSKLVREQPKGDPPRGERVFFSRVAACSRCHQYEGRGARIGPDLTLVAGQLTRERLLDTLLNPSKEIAPQYVSYAVRKTDGTSLSGVFVGEDGARNQQFADAQGTIHRLRAEEIEERLPLDKSLMPENFGQTLTLGEIADLIEFLSRK